MLLKAGCDHAHKDEDGNTARDAAALRSHSKVAAFLETKGHLFQRQEPLLQEIQPAPEGGGAEGGGNLDGEEAGDEVVDETTFSDPPVPDAEGWMQVRPAALAPWTTGAAEPRPKGGPGTWPPKSHPRVLIAAGRQVPPGDVVVEKVVGKRWLDAAKGGDIAQLRQLLACNGALLYYRGKGISFGFVGHSALHWAASRSAVAIIEWLVADW